MRTKRLRRHRERGGTLLVAVVMIFVMVAMIELMLAAPNAELKKVQSSGAKEHALASADAGVHDAAAWLTGHWGLLRSLVTDPHSVSGSNGVTASGSAGSGSTKDLMVMTFQEYPPNYQTTTLVGFAVNNNYTTTPSTSPGYGPGGAISCYLNAKSSAANVTFTIDTTTGMYPWPEQYVSVTSGASDLNHPYFEDGTGVSTTNNFLAYGDPVLGNGEYAYRILSLGNGYYQVDCEGRAQGLTYVGASASPSPSPTVVTGGSSSEVMVRSTSKFVARVTAVFYLPPPPFAPLPGAFSWFGPGCLQSNFAGPTPNPATTTSNSIWNPITIPSPLPSPLPSPMVYLNCNPPSGNSYVISGSDNNNVNNQYSGNTAGMAVQGWALGIEPPGGINNGNGNGNNATTSYISQSTSPSLSPTDSIWTSIGYVVNYARTSGGYDSSSYTWTDANTNGSYSTSGPSSQPVLSIGTAGVQHYTYGVGVDTPGGPYHYWVKTLDNNAMNLDGLIYIRFPHDSVVDCSIPLIQVNGMSSQPAGILVMDFENNVTFINQQSSSGQSYYWFQDDGNPSAWQGGVVAYQQGRINFPFNDSANNNCPTLNWIYSNGGQQHGILYNSQAIGQAMTAVHPTPKLVSYVVVQ